MTDDKPERTPEQIARVQLVMDLKKEMLKCLDGHPNEIVGTAISDLVATHMASCHAANRQDTFMLRTRLLEEHIERVLRLIPINEAQMLRAVRKNAN